MPEILPLALTAALDPALLAVVALLLARDGGDRRLLVFTVSAMGAGFAVGAAILLGLGGAGFTVPSGDSPPPWLEIVVGGILLAVAATTATGLDAHLGAVLRSHRHVPSRAADDAGKERTPSRLRRAAESEALWPIFVAGVLWGAVPDALYLAALALLAKSGDPVFVAQVGSAAVFQVVAYLLAILPLIAWVVAPDRARAAVDRASARMSAHRRTVVLTVVAIAGAYLLFQGLTA